MAAGYAEVSALHYGRGLLAEASHISVRGDLRRLHRPGRLVLRTRPMEYILRSIFNVSHVKRLAIFWHVMISTHQWILGERFGCARSEPIIVILIKRGIQA